MADAQTTQTLASYMRNILSLKNDAWKKEWEAESRKGAVKNYRESCLKPTTNAKLMPELTFHREVLRWSTAARSGHSHFADYHERFEQDLHFGCGRRGSQIHPLFCPSAKQHRGNSGVRS